MDCALDAWSALGRRRRIGGHELFVIDSGESDRPALLLIHGFPTSSWDWAPLWDALSASHRLIAFDLLGFGFSDKPDPHDYRISEQADLCEAVLGDLGLSEADLIAHDYGDTVAQELLARQNEGRSPIHWRSVCLLNGGLFPETHRPRLIQKLLAGPLGPLLNRLTSKQRFDTTLRAIFGPETPPGQDLLDGYWRLLNHGGRRAPTHRLLDYIRERRLHRKRWLDALIYSEVPIGLINGSADPISGAHMVARYRELIPRDDFIVELPRIGHFPQVEAPSRVVEAYRNFLRSRGRRVAARAFC
ncbi:alpha/beta fold hydrolase [Wenzhouxiangella marina]|uniref:Alpha/beta hydrolase n=1 Tax=Wenzhouxiangella marina TaxID=1579979 RepID=A0A0K0Y0B2_9GAMM|nr:alpha/beta hydrolase [Wenzhouxiangella marina]AKS43383.1 alpha/beta hydrolase [Wenzhouxiangella marina]MBB6088501.1 pimeloyl-ACP methyl ester carboxylesterase [Wenzhouxiangella marina]